MVTRTLTGKENLKFAVSVVQLIVRLSLISVWEVKKIKCREAIHEEFILRNQNRTIWDIYFANKLFLAVAALCLLVANLNIQEDLAMASTDKKQAEAGLRKDRTELASKAF